MPYQTIIGLEIHAELNTKSKMFCSCDNKADNKKPNSTVCPICLGHPGTLPVPNKQAIEYVITAGLALNCQINIISKFDRKNYFYPDLPKGYQISQYDQPLAYNGYLELDGKKIKITRIHLEEDTGKSFHPKNSDHTLIDFNRAGTPLMELVTHPIIQDSRQAKKFCQKYQQILRYLEISQADMESGEMRCEANVSLQKKGKFKYEDGQIKPLKNYKLNNKVELKNINSFRTLEKAIEFEIKRQKDILKNKGNIQAETRGWNENKNETVSQRIKETSADYRYFPEPDIPPLRIDGKWLAKIKASLPELPDKKIARFTREYGLNQEIAEILTADKSLANWSEQVISELNAWIEANGDKAERQEKKLAKTASNWIIGELIKHLKANQEKISNLKLTAENFAELICLIYQNKINSSAGQTILDYMYKNGGDPTDIMRDMGLEQIDDKANLKKIVKKIILNYPQQTKEYKKGKHNIIQFLLGKIMAETKGKANPKMAKEILEELLTQ
jgi:aspartyl-tRNA(Asn)/glutamyl-tRNA(Gln) amidotransferase subunit B